MWRVELRAVGLGLLWLASSGCTSQPTARYVYQDGEYGVVAIPVNTYLMKADYRAQAENLMARHFPEGYEIVRAEEVNEGERILELGRKTDFATEPNLSALNQMIKLGKLERSTSFEEKDKLQVRESRIIYKKRSVNAPGQLTQFSAMATLSPPLYLDPNEMMRRQETLAKASLKKPDDHEVRKTSASTTSASTASTPSPPPK